MIQAIIPIPQKVKPYTVISGKLDIGINQDSPVLPYGRDIIVPPLIFYKFFSVWMGIQYEHVFVTDEIFDIYTLQSHISTFTDQPTAHACLLCPISVKKITQQRTTTWLFHRSIQYLLQNYKFGIPLRAINGLNDEVYIHEQVLTNPATTAIYSHGDLGDWINSLCTQDGGYFVQEINEISYHLSQDCPNMVAEYVYNALYAATMFKSKEIAYALEPNSSGLFDFTIPEHAINDPITYICLNNNPYVNSNLLVPYLGHRNLLAYHYHNLLHETAKLDDKVFTYLDIQQVDAVNLWGMITELNSISYSDFSLYLSDNEYIPSYDHRFPSTLSTPSLLALKNWLCTLFLNKQTQRQPFVKLEFTKTWTDEIFICCTTIHDLKVYYYLNLALFRLTSPSLINQTLFQ
jgi:hypothetical protein